MTKQTQITLRQAGEQIVRELFTDMRHSTWYDGHPAAYNELVQYQKDMELTVQRVLKGKEIFE